MSNLSNKCRACLGFTPNMVSLFEPYRSATIAHFITSFTDIKILKSQVYLPMELCSVCLEDLEVVLKFTKKCKDTDRYLGSLFELERLVDTCELTDVKLEPTDEKKSEEDDEVNASECDNDYLGQENGDYEDKLDVNLRSLSESEIVDEACNLTDVKLKPFHEIKSEECDEANAPEFESDNDFFTEDKVDVDSSLEPLVKKQTFTYYECHDCGERLRTKCKLRVHWKRLHSHFTCEKCKRIFKVFKPFKKHSQKGCLNPIIVRVSVEGKKRHFHCRHCDYETYQYNSIRLHSNRHTGVRAFSCDICGKTFTQWSGVTSHKETAHKLYKMEITCDYCGKHIKGRTKCYKHLRLHLNTTFQCDICKVVLKRKQSLQDHIKRHYEKKINIPATCEICGKVFASNMGLQNHIQLIHNSTLHSCKICKYQNKNIYILRKHERWHFQDNMLQCSLCYNFFESQEKIERHMHINHGSKTHFCVFCKRGFMKRYVLLKHQTKNHAEQLKSHTGPTYIRRSGKKDMVKVEEIF